MLALKKIAVTGGVACGKSTVCRLLEELGAHVVSADHIVHSLLSSDPTTIRTVAELLGSEVLQRGKVDRQLVAKKVFNNLALLHALEALLHPLVEKEISYQYQKVQQIGSASLFVAEIPLLYEAGADSFFDAVIAVTAPWKQCQERFITNNPDAIDTLSKRAERQLPQQEKARRAQFVIDNSGDLSTLEANVKELYHKLCNQ